MYLKAYVPTSSRAVWRLALAAALFVGLAPLAVAAQGVGSSSIHGKVTDETGGALPGVTVTASSPSLQVRQLVEVTDHAGQYRFVDLPPGVYRVTFELVGFRTAVRAELRLSAGFVARIDEVMKVGAVEETVTVSGESPVVDLTKTSSSTNFTSEALATAPVVRTMWQLMAMTPGVRMTGRPDVGGNTVGTQQGYANYGTSGMVKPELEGIDTREGTDSAGSYHDDRSLEEVQIRPVGNDAEMALPGSNLVMIVKSGGNEFHGLYTAAGESPRLQSNNVDEALRAQGVTEGNPLKLYWDLSGDLGGRIVRDKLWFYGAYRNHRGVVQKIGYARNPGPDGVYGTADDEMGEDSTTLTNYTLKLSYQPTPKYKVIGFIHENSKRQPERDGSFYRPAENSYDFWWKPWTAKGELQAMLGDRLLVDVVGGGWWYWVAYDAQNYALVAGKPTRHDRYTGRYTGPNEGDMRRSRRRWQSTGSLSYFPEEFLGGDHSLKAGYRITFERYGERRPNRPSGNYLLRYDRLGGLLFQPVEIVTYNLPVDSLGSRMTEYSGYVKDTWKIGDRWTTNLGVRWERYHSFLEPQTKVQGTFGTSGEFPGIDVATWTAFAPRVGLAVDLTGDAKTALKMTWGIFNHTMGEQFADEYNQNRLISTTYRWRDLNGNNDYTAGEVNLDPNGPDFISVSGASNNIVNPDLEQPRTQEISVGLDRELIANFSGRVLYVYKREQRLYGTVNVLRPYSAYNIPITRLDPGPDGQVGTPDDAELVTIYDYDAAYRGARFVGNMRVNREGRDDWFQSIEFTLNKRHSANWDMLASFMATKKHDWLVGIPQSPNDQYFPLDQTWEWSFKAVGSYILPRGIQVAAFFQHWSGAATERTYVFRSADPLGGTPLRQLSTVTLRLEPRGSKRLPNMNMLNLRAIKKFSLGKARSLDIEADCFNALNANTASTINYASGPLYGRITAILPPRIARLGVSLKF